MSSAFIPTRPLQRSVLALTLRSMLLAGATSVSLASAAAQASAETKLLRFPDVHGERVAFVYAGDLYIASTQGGLAQRLDRGFDARRQAQPRHPQQQATSTADDQREDASDRDYGSVPDREKHDYP